MEKNISELDYGKSVLLKTCELLYAKNKKIFEEFLKLEKIYAGKNKNIFFRK